MPSAGSRHEVFEDGELVIHAFVDVGYARRPPEPTSLDDGKAISVDVESIEVEKAIEEADRPDQ